MEKEDTVGRDDSLRKKGGKGKSGLISKRQKKRDDDELGGAAKQP